MDCKPAEPRELSQWQQIKYRCESVLIRFRRRYIPHLVWHGDEVDVCVTFKENKLPEMEVEPGRMHEVVSVLHRGSFHECEKLMREVGITFDTGVGSDGRDWEWDWSLSGPISVKFRRRAARPERRV